MKTLQNRREFLKISTAGTVGVMVFSPFSGKSAVVVDKKSFGMGLQLYTVRNAMGIETDEPADKLATLQKISDLGYKYLELADYQNGLFYGYAPQELKKIVTDLDMEIISSHTQVEAEGITLENAQKMADDHAVLGVKYCVQPWIEEVDRSVEKYKKMIADWNQVGEIMKGKNIQFAYHNHDFEFKPTKDGQIPYYDIFLAEMDPNMIVMELDLYWATMAGQDPVEMFNRYPGRFQLWHLKDSSSTAVAPIYDVDEDSKSYIAPVGSGVIDFKRIFDARDVAGMKYTFVEDDNQGNGDAFGSIETSINNLTSNILS